MYLRLSGYVGVSSGGRLCVVDNYGNTNGAATSCAILPSILRYGRFIGTSRVTHKLSPFGPRDVTVRTKQLVLREVGRLLEGRRGFSVRAALTAEACAHLIRHTRRRKCGIGLVCF